MTLTECELLGTALETPYRECILRVESTRSQWYLRLLPWVHLVLLVLIKVWKNDCCGARNTGENVLK